MGLVIRFPGSQIGDNYEDSAIREKLIESGFDDELVEFFIAKRKEVIKKYDEEGLFSQQFELDFRGTVKQEDAEAVEQQIQEQLNLAVNQLLRIKERLIYDLIMAEGQIYLYERKYGKDIT